MLFILVKLEPVYEILLVGDLDEAHVRLTHPPVLEEGFSCLEDICASLNGVSGRLLMVEGLYPLIDLLDKLGICFKLIFHDSSEDLLQSLGRKLRV